MTATRLILVGRVAGAFGVRGEVRVATYTEDPMALVRYRDLRREDGRPALTLTAARPGRPGSGEIVVRAVGIEEKDAADALRGLRLYVPREALPSPGADEFYHADLIGLAAATPEGDPLGVVRAVHDFGAGEMLEVEPPGGAATVLHPFNREVVPEIDLAGGRLTIVPPVEVEAGDEGDG